MLDLNLESTQTALSVIKDPFVKDCIGDISIQYNSRPMFGGSAYWYAVIQFQNGLSKGQQRTPDCKTFDEVIAHVKAVLDSIKDKV